MGVWSDDYAEDKARLSERYELAMDMGAGTNICYFDTSARNGANRHSPRGLPRLKVSPRLVDDQLLKTETCVRPQDGARRRPAQAPPKRCFSYQSRRHPHKEKPC